MKIITIGTNHAGTSFLRTLSKINKKCEIITYDKNSNISFLGCGIALWVGGEFEDPSGLFYSNEKELTSMNIKVNMEHEVLSINEKNKNIIVKNLKTNEIFEDHYDKLIFAGGSWPVVLDFPGINLENIFLSKLFQHAQKIKKIINDKNIKNITVIGAGYIGVELAEAFYKYGKTVTLVDSQERIVSRYFDKEFTDILENKMINKGVKLKLNERVVKFEGENNKVKFVVTDKNKYLTDAVILSMGFRPRTQIFKKKLDMLGNGAIIVNDKMQTSNKDIYAIGDAVALKHNILNKPVNIALATNAIKSGIIAAFNISEIKMDFPGMQGTNGISVFDCHYTSTGFSEEFSKTLNLNIKSEFLVDKNKPEFMKSARDVMIKIVYNPETLKIIGAQIGSLGDNHEHNEAIFVFSLAIQKGMTLYEMALMDFYFLPHYNKPFNYILKIILNALNLKY